MVAVHAFLPSCRCNQHHPLPLSVCSLRVESAGTQAERVDRASFAPLSNSEKIVDGEQKRAKRCVVGVLSAPPGGGSSRERGCQVCPLRAPCFALCMPTSAAARPGAAAAASVSQPKLKAPRVSTVPPALVVPFRPHSTAVQFDIQSDGATSGTYRASLPLCSPPIRRRALCAFGVRLGAAQHWRACPHCGRAVEACTPDHVGRCVTCGEAFRWA
eukprot:706193-Pleurochrysis_carterae.AAC.2